MIMSYLPQHAFINFYSLKNLHRFTFTVHNMYCVEIMGGVNAEFHTLLYTHIYDRQMIQRRS